MSSENHRDATKAELVRLSQEKEQRRLEDEARLQKEVERLRKEVESLRKEVESLRKEKEQRKLEDQARQKAENESLRKEVESLRKEKEQRKLEDEARQKAENESLRKEVGSLRKEKTFGLLGGGYNRRREDDGRRRDEEDVDEPMVPLWCCERMVPLPAVAGILKNQESNLKNQGLVTDTTKMLADLAVTTGEAANRRRRDEEDRRRLDDEDRRRRNDEAAARRRQEENPMVPLAFCEKMAIGVVPAPVVTAMLKIQESVVDVTKMLAGIAVSKTQTAPIAPTATAATNNAAATAWKRDMYCRVNKPNDANNGQVGQVTKYENGKVSFKPKSRAEVTHRKPDFLERIDKAAYDSA